MKSKDVIVLEPSTNTHVVPTDNEVEVVEKVEKMNTFVLNTNGKMIVEHGHHNTVATEPTTRKVIKITQQEYNPILKELQNAFD